MRKAANRGEVERKLDSARRDAVATFKIAPTFTSLDLQDLSRPLR